ncbi:MAG: FAD-dependent oxidoreductase, partial [Verrucomicrobiales bacterium]|nr:FAD-dependent oxidoreductase [Verrucomicrobiales bacterium]
MGHLSALQPLDEHNRKLQSNVHPPDWENPVPDGVYNMVVIGGGTAGLVTAAGAAGLGAKVALIERGLLGGDCLNVGCVPSKAILAAARRAAQVRDAEEFGIRVPEGVRIDFAAVMERMRRLRSNISPHDSARRFTEMGIDVFLGQGKFTGAGTIDVNGTELKFKKATIATGARAAAPSIPGLEEVEYLTNETLFSLTAIPKRFGVIGAGPVGVEMAQSFARLGSEVYLVESNGGILPKDDPEAGAAVTRALEKDGVTILSGGRKLRLEKKEGADVKMIVDGEN